MKSLFLSFRALLLGFLFFGVVSCGGDGASQKSAGADSLDQSAAGARVLVHNFHSTNRCATCMAIEEGTTQVLNTWFQTELKSGLIKRMVVNVDEDTNKVLAEKYGAFGTSLYITLIKDGKEQITDYSEDAFSYARNEPDTFQLILRKAIAEGLK